MNMQKFKEFIDNSAKKLPSIIGIIICILLTPILIMNITIITKSYLNPDEVPDFFGTKPFVVVTGSMEPEINGGDLIITKEVDPSMLKENDIIAYKDENVIITHRIVELTEKDGEPAFITQGDANNVADENAVTYAQVEGIYVFKIGKVGGLALFMQTPVGMLTFIGIPLCGFIIYDIVRRRREDEKEKIIESEAQAEIERLKAKLAEKENKPQ